MSGWEKRCLAGGKEIGSSEEPAGRNDKSQGMGDCCGSTTNLSWSGHLRCSDLGLPFRIALLPTKLLVLLGFRDLFICKPLLNENFVSAWRDQCQTIPTVRARIDVRDMSVGMVGVLWL